IGFMPPAATTTMAQDPDDPWEDGSSHARTLIRDAPLAPRIGEVGERIGQADSAGISFCDSFRWGIADPLPSFARRRAAKLRYPPRKGEGGAVALPITTTTSGSSMARPPSPLRGG